MGFAVNTGNHFAVPNYAIAFWMFNFINQSKLTETVRFNRYKP